MGIVGIHPGCFRKSGKQRSCGIRNLEEDTEDGRRRNDGGKESDAERGEENIGVQ